MCPENGWIWLSGLSFISCTLPELHLQLQHSLSFLEFRTDVTFRGSQSWAQWTASHREPASAGTCHLCGCDRKEHKYQCYPSTDLIATLVCTLEIQAKLQICVCGLLTSLQMSNATRVMCPETMSQHRHCHLAS